MSTPTKPSFFSCLASNKILGMCTPTTTLPMSNNGDKAAAETNTRKNHRILRKLHYCGTLTSKTIGSAFLITVVLWLFARLPDPQVHVTSFAIQSLTSTANPPPTLITYSFNIHNPDLYKSVYYDVLVLRISHSGNYTEYGATVNFHKDGKRLHQRPGGVKTFSNHSLDYSKTDLRIVSHQLPDLKTKPEYIFLRFVMLVSFKAFNQVIATRQLMKNAALYFDVNGTAIIRDHGGLALSGSMSSL